MTDNTQAQADQTRAELAESRLDGEAWQRLTDDRDQLRRTVDALRLQRDTVIEQWKSDAARSTEQVQRVRDVAARLASMAEPDRDDNAAVAMRVAARWIRHALDDFTADDEVEWRQRLALYGITPGVKTQPWPGLLPDGDAA